MPGKAGNLRKDNTAHATHHKSQVEQKITREKKDWSVSWLNHFGGQIGLCLVKLNTHRPSAKPGHSQGYTFRNVTAGRPSKDLAQQQRTTTSSARNQPRGGAGAQGRPRQGEPARRLRGWLSAPEPSLSRGQGAAPLTKARRWRHPRAHQCRRGPPLCLSLKTNRGPTQAATLTNLTNTAHGGSATLQSANTV